MTRGSALSDEPRARGISLWLMPEGGIRDELAALIDRLAARLRTSRFDPHVTLLPGISGSEAEVLERARALAAELAPLDLRPTGVAGLDQHFRCLFFRIAGSGPLREAHARAALRFGLEPDPSFDPHLSLVYGTLDSATKAGLSPELSAAAPPRLEIRHLHVWRTEGPAGEWRELGAFALGSPAPA